MTMFNYTNKWRVTYRIGTQCKTMYLESYDDARDFKTALMEANRSAFRYEEMTITGPMMNHGLIPAQFTGWVRTK